MRAKKGDWVQIYSILLEPGDRSDNLPEDTAGVPYEMRLTGYLINDSAEEGTAVEIETAAGRTAQGTLIRIFPSYTHSFGNFVPEIKTMEKNLKKLLRGLEE